MDVAQKQGFHFLPVTEERRVGVDLYLHFSGQAFFRELLEKQCALSLGRVFGHDMGELDHDGISGLGQTGSAQGKSTGESFQSRFEH
ncbi:hypothetical protein D3C80_1160470 [compost metagenome]